MWRVAGEVRWGEGGVGVGGMRSGSGAVGAEQVARMRGAGWDGQGKEEVVAAREEPWQIIHGGLPRVYGGRGR